MVCAFPTWARFESSGSGTQSDPTISSITYCDHDYFFEHPSQKGSGMPNHYIGDLLPTIAISGLSRVRTELVRLAVVPALTPHPVQMHGQLSGHGYLGDLSSTSHGQVEECAAPFWMAAHRDLRCFHQQKPEQHIALLAVVSQSPPVPAGLLLGNQSDVAGDLLAAVKTFWRSDH
jgi:hypothetical protein